MMAGNDYVGSYHTFLLVSGEFNLGNYMGLMIFFLESKFRSNSNLQNQFVK